MYSYYLKAILKKQSLRLSLCSSHLPLHKGGNGAALVGTSGSIVGASIGRPLLAAGAVRLEILPIHFLRQHGIENTDQTVAARYRVGAEKSTANVRSAIASTAVAKLASP